MADDILTQAESAIRETERELADLLQHEVASAFDAPDAPPVDEPPRRAPLNTTANDGAESLESLAFGSEAGTPRGSGGNNNNGTGRRRGGQDGGGGRRGGGVGGMGESSVRRGGGGGGGGGVLGGAARRSAAASGVNRRSGARGPGVGRRGDGGGARGGGARSKVSRRREASGGDSGGGSGGGSGGATAAASSSARRKPQVPRQVRRQVPEVDPPLNTMVGGGGGDGDGGGDGGGSGGGDGGGSGGGDSNNGSSGGSYNGSPGADDAGGSDVGSDASSFANDFGPLVDLENNVVDGAVLDLKHRLRSLERAHELLGRQYDALQRKYHQESARSESKCLRYCKQIDNLTAALEQLIEKNVDVGAELAQEQAQGSLAKDRAGELEENLATMRQLMMDYLSKPTQGARRSVAEKEFWKKLATPEVLALSRPPRSFPVQKVHPVHVTELTKVRGQLQLQENENKRLRSKLGDLMASSAEFRTRSLESRKESQCVLSQQSVQLMGAVRRINYLLAKNKEVRGGSWRLVCVCVCLFVGSGARRGREGDGGGRERKGCVALVQG